MYEEDSLCLPPSFTHLNVEEVFDYVFMENQKDREGLINQWVMGLPIDAEKHQLPLNRWAELTPMLWRRIWANVTARLGS
jgi:hypothetical protein